MAQGGREDSLPGLISEAAPLRLFLAAAKDIPDQALTAVQALFRSGKRGWALAGPAGSVQGRLDQRPASPDPVAVAAVDKFVCASREATLRSILSRREPSEQLGDVKIPGRETR